MKKNKKKLLLLAVILFSISFLITLYQTISTEATFKWYNYISFAALVILWIEYLRVKKS